MSLGQRLKNRLFSLPEEIAAGVKQFSSHSTSSSVTSGLASLALSTGSPRYQPPRVNLEAGSDLLEHYQNLWEQIHLSNEENARLASKCDTLVTSLHDKYERQWNSVLTLQMLVSQIPRINEQVESVMRTLGDLESSFSDVEVALLALEDTIDARELQEKQLDQRFQVAMYQEKRKAEFNQLSNRLKVAFEVKKHELERSTSLVMQKEGQRGNFQRKSDDEKTKYLSLKVPSRRDPDASLETVDLNEDESGQDANSFLEGDISPLPEDADLSPTTTVNLQRGGDNGQVVRDGSEEEGALDALATAAMPRDESMYYTPDATMDSLADTLVQKKA